MTRWTVWYSHVSLTTFTAISAFQASPSSLSLHSRPTTNTALELIPLTKFRDELTFFSTKEENRCGVDKNGTFRFSTATTSSTTAEDDNTQPFALYIAEENDLPEITLFVMKAFGAAAISISTSEFSVLEKRLMEPAIDLFNGYYAVNAFAEVLWGLRIRQSDRLLNDSVNDISGPVLDGLETYVDKIEAANRKSLILVVARPSSNQDNNSSKWVSIDSNVDVIASVELRLQPCDAKIPFSLPWWDAIERKIAAFFRFPQSESANQLQPYLSSLCVDESYRGQRIGRAMVRCLEDIASTKWGYSKMYLHVDGENPPALNLYKSEGYRDVGRRWNPFWAGRAADIGYFVKNIKP